MASIERIDFHTHAVTPGYRKYCQKARLAGNGKPDGMPGIPTNKELSDICRAYPDRFGFFASLPLPDVEGSLAEIDYALDHLGAVGFQVLSNAHRVYPGDKLLDPVFDRLSARKAIVFLHPTSCHYVRTVEVGGSGESGSESTTVVETFHPLPQHPAPMLEFMFDSTRAISNLLLSGTVKRCSGITFLACHCGATLPPMLERIAAFGKIPGSKSEDALTAEEIKSTLRTRFYFDLAGFPFPDQIHGLLRVTDTSRLVYGSDYPYTPGGLVEDLARRMDEEVDRLFGEDVKKQIYHENGGKMLRNATL
ncbi:Uncharacterized protein T310_5063 [Rasamsonia emersonii CBS 393.64]|uniref:6-methylsalicylate decarboxylase n=1 Tax=Rasamsonia emersonii (strain ATCC 16479 / CBS 393.64 / IMI 116815) TaxID=1408163 RepID=A0A0F4YTG9_RASE3|nr:Uncharacterized protein T310_5063 [Rasamsonia emersonii CBS 393.64]KKA20923.1 Uncharacterized protein T310_5063 [Rasamsonia emersonii CBS 393.64]